jgi:squalene-associated FAD-dependent desaturase
MPAFAGMTTGFKAMSEGTVHIVGAGLAGLAAAVHATAGGRKVRLYEAGSHAGGRCRSYVDKELGVRIDNGNHLMLSCNEAALSFLQIIGAEDTVTGPDAAVFPFMDIETGERWTICINDGVFPKWIFDKKARVPGTKLRDYLKARKLFSADRFATVGEKLDTQSLLYKRLLHPLCVAIMNTQGAEAGAQVLANVFKEIFAKGGKGSRPVLVKEGLSESFVDPALRFIETRGGEVHFGKRLRGLEIQEDELRTLVFADEKISLNRWDWVVLALPFWVVNDLLPGLPTPRACRSIVNAHFKVDVPKSATGMTGLINAHAEWVFEKDGIVSTTTSAAEAIVDKPAEECAALLWRDVAKLYGLDEKTLPAYRIVKEKRATFAATPDEIIRRPKVEPRHTNLLVCGDWTNTGLPSTIEGAIRSGRSAAECILPVGKNGRIIE